MTMPLRLLFLSTILLFPFQEAMAANSGFESCVLRTFEDSANDELSVKEVRQQCQNQPQLRMTEAVPDTSLRPVAEGSFLNFFEPYKDNYISYGSIETRSGADPFSGKTGDIRFQIGMKFGLFQNIPQLEILEPLYFGYSQRSWWDIAESSAPFREHNYNPEIFWDFDRSSPRHGMLGHGLGRYVDQLGFEHQSNGLAGTNSRSWDRIYAQKSLDVLPGRLSFDLKLWNIVNLGEENSDISDFLGNSQIGVNYRISEDFELKLKTTKGHQSEKFNYQLDLLTNMKWMNGQLFLTYYDGYGNALISYNEKTRSLRGGVFFPF